MALHHNPRIVTDGLVLALDAADVNSYPGSGTTWYDLSSNGNDGTLTNGPTFSSDHVGALVFDGANDHIALSTAITLTDFTATAVYSISSYNGGWAMLFGNSDLDNFIGIGTSGAILRIQDTNSTNSDLAYNSIEDQLTFLQVVQSGNSNTWYINGQSVGNSTNNSYAGIEITHMVHYGTGSSLGIFGGKYYLAHLYNRALTASEIQQNYEAQKTRFGL